MFAASCDSAALLDGSGTAGPHAGLALRRTATVTPRRETPRTRGGGPEVRAGAEAAEVRRAGGRHSGERSRPRAPAVAPPASGGPGPRGRPGPGRQRRHGGEELRQGAGPVDRAAERVPAAEREPSPQPLREGEAGRDSWARGGWGAEDGRAGARRRGREESGSFVPPHWLPRARPALSASRLRASGGVGCKTAPGREDGRRPSAVGKSLMRDEGWRRAERGGGWIVVLTERGLRLAEGRLG